MPKDLRDQQVIQENQVVQERKVVLDFQESREQVVIRDQGEQADDQGRKVFQVNPDPQAHPEYQEDPVSLDYPVQTEKMEIPDQLD